ncbi:MAG: DUF2807 domain-containing protein [Cyclobacteriaceae bacterium]
MKTKLTLALAVIVTLASCDKTLDLCELDSGPTQSFVLDMDQFDRISLLGPIDLEITQGPNQDISVETTAEIFDHMEYEVKNEHFEIGFKNNVRCFADAAITVKIEVPDIESIYASGVSNIVSTNELDLGSLRLDASGSITSNLTGRVANQELVGSGTLEVQHFDLTTDNTSIKISGTGELEINCQEKLDIDVSGAATIKYIGEPTITQEVSGTINLISQD